MGDRGPLEAGDVVDGKYRIDRVLGEGGMGLVLVATDIRLERQVAIKVLLPEFAAAPSWVARFLREARAAVQLSSEHAVRVHEVGELADGTPYMVMEYLIGKDLAAVLEDVGKLPLGQAVGYVLQAIEAIADAHAAGIVHRDIKPANLFLTRRTDGTSLIKVLDFGLAKTPAVAGKASLTGDSAVFGSPQYMSPEQLRGAAQVDGRTDIWALGITLHEFLTGVAPFEALTVPELGAMIMRDAPVPPHERFPEIPAGLSAILLRCLEKDPDRRYANVADFASALDPWTEPVMRGASARVRRILAATSAMLRTPQAAEAQVHPLAATAPLELLVKRESIKASAKPPSTTATEAVLDAAPGRSRATWLRSWALAVSVAVVASVTTWILFNLSTHGGDSRVLASPSTTRAEPEVRPSARQATVATPPFPQGSAPFPAVPSATGSSEATKELAAPRASAPPGSPYGSIRPRFVPDLPTSRLPTTPATSPKTPEKAPPLKPEQVY